MPKSMQSGHWATHAQVCQARECAGDDGHAPVLPIPDVQGRMHNQTPSPGGPAEKASMAVAGIEEGEVEDANACCCWSRRSSRGRDGDAGDVVVLDEARRGTQIFQHKAE
jgi:hypothetical protein